VYNRIYRYRVNLPSSSVHDFFSRRFWC